MYEESQSERSLREHFAVEHDANSRDQRDQHAEQKAFGLGILLGALVGASAALLMAPASGKQTRKKLKKRARRVYADGGEAIGDLWEDAGRKSRKLRKSTGRSLERGVRKGREYAGSAVELVSRRGRGWW